MGTGSIWGGGVNRSGRGFDHPPHITPSGPGKEWHLHFCLKAFHLPDCIGKHWLLLCCFTIAVRPISFHVFPWGYLRFRSEYVGCMAWTNHKTGLDYRQGKNFHIFSITARYTLGRNNPAFYWTTGAVSPGINRTESGTAALNLINRGSTGLLHFVRPFYCA
jgi:hypothetical protein